MLRTVARHLHLQHRCGAAWAQRMSDALGAPSSVKTGIVMLNMGGPETLDDVEFFLQNLFSDREIIQLGMLQNWLGPRIARRRSPKIREQYAAIGGGSPIRRWTELQGRGMAQLLDKLSPETAPHKHYIAFRYANPLTESALLDMKRDGVQRVVAFSQYPHYSCTTSGSSLNHMWREIRRLGLGDAFRWSVIDRWPDHPGFIHAVAKRIREGLQEYPEAVRSQVALVFSAHSIPMRIVNRGDPYPQEVASTVQHVMQALGFSNPYVLAWQSQVGYLPWLGPQTGEVLHGLGKQGHKYAMAVPIAFTSDHIETLYEIDKEYGAEAQKAGLQKFTRAPSLNDDPAIVDAMARIVHEHLQSGRAATSQYALTCPGCTNPTCRTVLYPVAEYQRVRDAARGVPTPSTVQELQ